MEPDLRERLQSSLGHSYSLDRELGGGGMARVFVAHEIALGRQVVIKVLPPELAADVSIERFKREIQLAAHLQHPHIVPVHSAGEVDGLPYYTMPLVEGESLRGRLSRDGELPISNAVAFLRDVAKALAYAHAHGVVHRDIKPENVLLSGGSAVVADFGIAKAVAESRKSGVSSGGITALGVAVGTPAYMAPEQAAAEGTVDHRADIYSFGCLAYELLTGASPFAGRTPRAQLAAHIGETPEPIVARRPTIPASLAALVMRCMEKHPADRPQSATEIITALDSVSTPDGTATWTGQRPKASGRRSLSSRLRERRTVIVGAAVAAVATLAVIGVTLRGGPGPALDRGVIAVLPFRVSGPDSLQYLREGMLDLLAATITGEGGVRSADHRTVLAALKRASADTDLPQQAAIDVASSLGAGYVLLGDIVATSRRLIINARALRIPSGNQVARASVEGPADSVPFLARKLGIEIVSLVSGERVERLPGLTRASLPALRAYLDGRVAYRRGLMNVARAKFTEAIRADSTFALAALSLQLAAQWGGAADSVSARGREIVSREREQLSRLDRALFAAVVGPHYPAPSSLADVHQAKEQYVAMAADTPEAWYLLGDSYFHFGTLLGFEQPLQRALRDFNRSIELDSNFAPPARHQPSLAMMLGDSLLARRVIDLRYAQDSDRVAHEVARLVYGLTFGDSSMARTARKALAALPVSGDPSALHDAAYDVGVGVQDVTVLLGQAVRGATTEAGRRAWSRALGLAHFAMGRPRQGLAYLRGADVRTSRTQLYLAGQPYEVSAVYFAIGMDADGAEAADAASRLTNIAWSTRAVPDSDRVTAALISEYWRLTHGDMSRTEATIALLKRAPTTSWNRGTPEMDLAMVNALRAHVARRADAYAFALRLDSLLRRGDTYVGGPGGTRQPLYNLMATRLFDALGDSVAALRASRRRAMGMPSPIHVSMLREEGQLASRLGDIDAAIRAYRTYLAIRYDPEPELRADVDNVRRELARIERRRMDR